MEERLEILPAQKQKKTKHLRGEEEKATRQWRQEPPQLALGLALGQGRVRPLGRRARLQLQQQQER
jgi:hypothetical protein